MWYRMAKKFVRKAAGIGGGIRRRRPTRNETADIPSEVEKLKQEEEARRKEQKNHPSHMTLEEKLQKTPNREGFMSIPVPVPKGLNDSAGVLPSGINDHHPNTNPGQDATQPGTFSEGFPENPDPKTRKRF